jgi:hypothetical protein
LARPLTELGYGVPGWLRLVPVDFEAGASWWERLSAAGFDEGQPAVVASMGVTMYLTKDANAATLRQLASLAPGSTVAMTFQPPLELLEEDERPGRQAVEKSFPHRTAKCDVLTGQRRTKPGSARGGRTADRLPFRPTAWPPLAKCEATGTRPIGRQPNVTQLTMQIAYQPCWPLNASGCVPQRACLSRWTWARPARPQRCVVAALP